MAFADQTLKFRRDRLVVCEGPDDQAFVSAYLRHIQNTSVEVRYPATNSTAAGNTQFGRYLGFQKRDPSRSNWDALRHILIITDGDGRPDNDVFDMVSNQMVAAHLQPPAALGCRSNGHPTIEILIIPDNIETFCKSAAIARNAHLANCVHQFHDVVSSNGWNQQEQGKLWLRSYLAASHRRDAFIQFTTTFNVSEFCDRYFDLNHGSLTPLRTAINRLTS